MKLQDDFLFMTIPSGYRRVVAFAALADTISSMLSKT